MFLKGITVIIIVDTGGTVVIRSPIMKKSLVLGIICLFIGSAFISCASRFDELIDQHQDNFYPGQGYEVNVNELGKAHIVAQSFKPSMTPLTKVDLAILTDIYTTQPVVVSIRSDLEGNDITSITVPHEQIPQDNISWCSFNFPNVTVVPGTTYYIIVRSNATGYGYCMGYYGSNLYPRGNTWLCYDGNWTAYYSEDCAFRTYSIDNQSPNPPTIDGPHYGKTNTTYAFSLGPITDPNGDQLYCLWGWGNGNTSGWLGPFNSGAIINTSHSWSEPGTYAIKAKLKDSYGAESNWSVPHVITIFALKKAFIFGRYTNLSAEDGYITIKAINLRLVIFKPFQFLHYIADEKITFSKDNIKALIMSQFLIGLFEVAI